MENHLDENRVCTEEEIKFVIEKTNSADLTQLKYALKSLGNFARLGILPSQLKRN